MHKPRQINTRRAEKLREIVILKANVKSNTNKEIDIAVEHIQKKFGGEKTVKHTM